MTRQIEDAVARNRQGRRRLENTSITVSSDASKSLEFGGNELTVSIDLEVYTRPLNSLILGHPDPEQGIGRGGLGDNRGDWTLSVEGAASEEFTRLGREAIIQILAGEQNMLSTALIGAGSTPARTRDSSLEAKTESALGFASKDDHNTIRIQGIYLSHEVGEAVGEFGVEDSNGDLVARVTVDGFDPARDQEVRGDVTIEFEGEGVGGSEFTDAGEAALADSLLSRDQSFGLDQIGIGSGDTDPEPSDAGLEIEVDVQNASRNTRSESIRVFTKWYDNEPEGELPVDIAELAVFGSTDELVWRTTVEQFELTEDFPLLGGVTIRVI